MFGGWSGPGEAMAPMAPLGPPLGDSLHSYMKCGVNALHHRHHPNALHRTLYASVVIFWIRHSPRYLVASGAWWQIETVTPCDAG